ncbi:MAG: hypothetical protein KZQ88_14170 [Candidatus Thiodiazotropha sp. (ex Dulcina madagascariensis)]|nr:hypothetical protein [Candidatus Thiodiazotropha sp. (ex Dulcina madagascariensis)]MCU7924939.1 hypothetical protein [Candidatus Thiodiazotropha sp. (ex Dulcina madagascariensis)]
MPDLTKGYQGNGRGNLAVLNAILGQLAVSWKGPRNSLPQELFTKNFMPYAKAHWAYDASRCNCEDLARAFWATWNYVGHKRQGLGPREVLPKANVEKCFGITDNKGMITKSKRVFNGPARGNVRNSAAGTLDGRCLFPVHYLCKIGNRYFDPTFDRATASRDDCVERKLDKLQPALWLSEDGQFLYERNQTPAAGFADSWNEFSAADWVSHAQWKDLTARSGHWRSAELKAVDSALESYGRARTQDNLATLKTAFQKWFLKKQGEVTHRNKESCINRLALNLGLARTLLKKG